MNLRPVEVHSFTGARTGADIPEVAVVGCGLTYGLDLALVSIFTT